LQLVKRRQAAQALRVERVVLADGAGPAGERFAPERLGLAQPAPRLVDPGPALEAAGQQHGAFVGFGWVGWGGGGGGWGSGWWGGEVVRWCGGAGVTPSPPPPEPPEPPAPAVYPRARETASPATRTASSNRFCADSTRARPCRTSTRSTSQASP